MADLTQELQELHQDVVRQTRENLAESGSPEDLKVAMQLLKQNNITAHMSQTIDPRANGKMAGKLNFSALAAKRTGKVVPLVDKQTG